MKFAVSVVIGSVGVLLAAPMTSTAQAPAPAVHPTLAFVSFNDDRAVIYLVTTEGTAKCLDEDTGNKKYGSGYEPSWSPDGKKIAFSRPILKTINNDVHVLSVVCVMDADGKNVKQLTKGWGELQPAWSPDGKRIAFFAKGRVCVMDADGANVKELTKEQLCTNPVWSPDGKKIAFMNSPPFTPKREVCVMDADGSNLVKLATIDPCDRPFAWAPDSKRLALFDGPNLSLVNPDGTNRQPLYSLAKSHLGIDPAWSPDGAKIVCASLVPGEPSAEVWTVEVKEGRATQLTNLGGTNILPRWSPDGKMLAFLHMVRGGKVKTSSVYVMDADGKQQTEIWRERKDMYSAPSLAWKPK
jgi:TolB protein